MSLKSYVIAVIWFMCSIVSSVANDAISKYVELHFFQITFFRFFFGSLVLVFVVKFYNKEQLFSNNLAIHIVRGILLFIATILWTYGLSLFPLTSATIISFCIPIFVLVLSIFFLNENFSWHRWGAVLIGLFGLVIALPIHSNLFELQECIFLVSAIVFALLDVINKKVVTQIALVPMILYSSLTIVTLSFVPMILFWQTPSFNELLLLLILGINSNLVLFFLLKAYLLCDISALAPYRYLELFLSAIIAYILFQETPTSNIFYGGAIIILSTILIVYLEKKKLYEKVNHIE